MHFLFEFYITLCALIGIIFIVIFVYEDIFIGKSHKNTYNFETAFSWIILICVSVPIINLCVAAAFLFLVYTRNKREQKELMKTE